MLPIPRLLGLSCALIFSAYFAPLSAQSTAVTAAAPLTLSFVAPPAGGAMLPEQFSGLSFEMELALPGKDGRYYFRPDNKPLLALFRTLGIESLRIGGNTADRPTVPFPSTKDLDVFFAFARKAGVKVIFTLRLRKGDPREAAAIARHIVDHHADVLRCFSIGNEPNVFAPEYPKFFKAWMKFADTVNLPEFAPAARFAGPSSTAGKTAWTRDFAQQLAGTGRLLIATQHIYPGGNADLVKEPAQGRELMLSRDWVEGYQKFHDSFVPQVLATGTGYRLVETNSFWNGGREGASNTFTASLWALDYLHWWAAHGAEGLNFHTGDYVAKSEENTRSMYSSFWSTPKGYEAKPVAYALKAFALTKRGQPFAVEIANNPERINVTAHGSRAADAVFVTIINKTHGAAARSAAVTLAARPGARAELSRLVTASGDIAATDGITVGGAAIKEDGKWAGRWTKTQPADASGKLTVEVPASSAVVVKISSR